VTNRIHDSTLTLDSTVVSEDTANSLQELLGNHYFAASNFSSLTDELCGLYTLKGGDIRQQGGNTYYNLNLKLAGPYQRYLWLVSSDEFDTDWDTIVTEPFTEGVAHNDFDEGSTATLDSTHTWFASSGDWRVDFGDDFLKCDNDSGVNYALLVEKAGKNYPSVSNIIIQGEIKDTSSVNTYYGLTFRRIYDNSATAEGLGYYFGFDITTDTFNFRKTTGASGTNLKQWTKWGDGSDVSLVTGTYYTLKVVCQGNKFDLYADDDNKTLTYLGTVLDDTYVTGWYGFISGDTNGNFDDFSLKIAKPQALSLPPGAHDTNQIRIPATSRLNDDVSADGLQRTVIAPDNPVTFKQQLQELDDDSCVLSLPLDEGQGSIVYDHSGNDNNGTITSALWCEEYLNGKNINYLKFDGSADLVTMDDAFTYYQDVTITALINPDTLGSRVTIFDGRDADNDGVILELNTSSQLECQYQTVDITSTSTLTAGTWYLVNVVIDKGAGTSQLYIDGATNGSAGDISSVNISGITTTAKIGRWAAAASNYFDGKVAFIQVHDRPLSASEVKYKYDAI